MKKISSLVLFMFCITAANAQQITNNGFEQWTTGLNPDPVGYVTFDQFVFTDLVSKSTDAKVGSYSVKLETKDINLFGETSRVPGIMISSNDPAAFSVGVPYNATPTKFKGWTKHNIPGIDSSTFAITLTRFNTSTQQTDAVAAAQAIFTGTQNNWYAFEATFEYATTELPDTMIVLASSSISDSANTQLSSIWFDEIILEGVSGVSVFNPIIIELLSAHPNPANGVVNIYTPDFSAGDYIVVSDITGRIISTSQISGSNTALRVNISGVLILELKDASGNTLRRSKLINQ
jgi:hypothetical protein